MSARLHLLGAAAVGVAALIFFGLGGVVEAPAPASAAAAPTVKANPLREAYYGDLHLHTAYSFDGYVLSGTQAGPDVAYRFARGEEVDFLGSPVSRGEPLDFLAVTDHAEMLGLFNQPRNVDAYPWTTPLGRLILGGTASVGEMLGSWGRGAGIGDRKDAAPIVESTWRRLVRSANEHYRPGSFTTFVGYEWTSAPGGQGLHRNVIYRGADGPSPFTAHDSQRPEDLWAYLARARAQGFQVLAIPHNSNFSNGLMFDWNDSDGRPIDQDYARRRALNEPVVEISQNKGTSETHPSLSAPDEFAGFEVMTQMSAASRPSAPPGSYVRDALGRGLAIASRVGVNPFAYGFAGGSDLHGALSYSAPEHYSGSFARINQGKGRITLEQARDVLSGRPPAQENFPGLRSKAGALTGVWAESNTREAIFDALRRKETFATSGSRLRFRFFGGWDLSADLSNDAQWISAAYRRGVPMGGNLPRRTGRGKAPNFLIWAVKDPKGANLDRVQIVKVWVEGGRHREKVYEAVWAGARRPGKTGALPAIGNSVDLRSGTYSNDIGAVQLRGRWTDPDFDPRQPAAYYMRVLEIPTPRWSTLVAIRHGLPLPADPPPTVQERGWSSPIWYMPGGSKPGARRRG